MNLVLQKKHLTGSIGLLGFLLTVPLWGEDVMFVEDFALSRDRAAALAQLIPGTEDYYYYHCLHHQNTQQFEQVDKLLKVWVKRHGNTERVAQIQTRQALLTYHQNPKATLAFIQQQLNLQFNHQQRQVDPKSNLPTRLDDNLISREVLARRALRRHENLQAFRAPALEWLIATELNPLQRRHLLQRLARPDYPQLAKLVVQDLNQKDSQGFGSLKIHNRLLRQQLDEILEQKPALRNDTKFVHTYLLKLWPGNDVDSHHDPEEMRAFLDRLWKFVSTLEPTHNSLKAHVLYHRLVFDQTQAVHDKSRFMAYLKLPRNMPYVNPLYLRSEGRDRYAADLNHDVTQFSSFPNIGDDQRLVRSYLMHFFVKEDRIQAYQPYLTDTFLNQTFAETKILNGIGNVEKWASLLPPDQFKALKERVDLRFAQTNKRAFAANEPVSLDLDIKNVDTLIVKIYEINAFNYCRSQNQQVNTDINLDGLVANHEFSHAYDLPGLRRERRHFELPQLNRAGVYVVDFIGNGKSSRALIQKGSLRYLLGNETRGHVFTILDEQGTQLVDATLWMEGHDYHADSQGRIVVPYSTNPRRQPIILSHEGLSVLHHFQHQAESYQLVAGIHVDRESLLQRREAELIVRPALLLGGTPVTLSVLKDVRLTLTSVDRDGTPTIQEIDDFELFEDRESTHPFQVPTRLASLQIQLTAKVPSRSRNEEQVLAATETFELNEIDASDHTEDVHLLCEDGLFRVELLGRSGESRVGQPLQLQLAHRDFRDLVNVTLQTGEDASVRLGALPGIVQLHVQSPLGVKRTWELPTARHSQYRTLHALEGETVTVAYMGAEPTVGRDRQSLLELRGGHFVADWWDAIQSRDGYLEIQGLPAGDFDLLLKDSGQRIAIRIARGKRTPDYVLGATRDLEIRQDRPLQIVKVTTDEETVQVQLANWGKLARVHLFATRYLPAYAPYRQLATVADVEPLSARRTMPRSYYVEQREIGDEYRYIINRKYLTKYPGNMLNRPELLLSPWAVRDTATDKSDPTGGEEFGSQAAQRKSAPGRDPQAAAGSENPRDFSDLGFLAEASAVLLNLVPDDNGLVRIPRQLLGTHQYLHFLAVDPLTTVYRWHALSPVSPRFADLRLRSGLDPRKHFAQQKEITVVAAGQSFQMSHPESAKYETYQSLEHVFELYTAISRNSTLDEFRFVVQWPTLTDDERREKYTKFACHELNFFLYHKDPEFFANVVRPHVANKRDKTFLDHWLLENDLTPYLEPWHYGRLNIVERILLGIRLDQETAVMRRHVADLYELRPRDIQQWQRQFAAALKGRSLLTVADGAVSLGNDVFDGEDYGTVSLEGAGRGRISGGIAGKALGLESLHDHAVEADAPALAAPMSAERAAAKSSKGQSLERRESLVRRAGRRASSGTERLQERYFAMDGLELGDASRLYVTLDRTQEWAENNYYHLPIQKQNADLIRVNPFWNDFAAHAGKDGPFVSPHWAAASGNFSEMLLAIAVLDLPFQSEAVAAEIQQPETVARVPQTPPADGASPDPPPVPDTPMQLSLRSDGPMLVVHQQIRAAEATPDKSPILVSQNFYQANDRYRQVEGRREDKFVADEFLVHTVYGCQVVVTNLSSSQRTVDVLLQVPVGAIPLQGGEYTRTVHFDLQPYNTHAVEYSFYFPAAGDFQHFPVHVAAQQKLLAYAEPSTLHVLDRPSQRDEQSWQFVSQYASDSQVLAFLDQHNLHELELSLIAFRMKHKPFFKKVIQKLSQRHAYDNLLWSYSTKHADLAAIATYLQHQDSLVARCGPYLDSPVVTVDPTIRRTYQLLEYRPLVNARAHQLGPRRQILNDRLFQQYHQLMDVLACRSQLDHDDLMSVTYYLLLQDRIEEAMEFFGRVEPDRLETRLQYDYFAAYLDCFHATPNRAREIANQYADYPVARWRNAFATITALLDELEGQEASVVDPRDRTQTQTQLADAAPSFQFKVDAKKIEMAYQNVAEAEVKYYLMDLELLFSRNPFVQEFSGQFSHIRANETQHVQLPADKCVFTLELPETMQNQNVLIEITAGGKTLAQTYCSHALNVQILENYGQLAVADLASGRALPQVYVKVYARGANGDVQFFKDGYTDLRGRFDYTSLSTNQLDTVQRFALLVVSEEHGALVREADPPKR